MRRHFAGVIRKSRSQPISRVLLRGALVSAPYGRHSSRRRVATTLEPPTRGLSEQPWIESFRPLTWCCSGWRLPRFTRSGPGVKPDRGDSSLWPCSSPSSTARAIAFLRLGVTQHPALRSPDFPLPAQAFTGGQRRSGWLRTRMVARPTVPFSRPESDSVHYASSRQDIVSPARKGTTVCSPNGYDAGTTHSSRLRVMVALLRSRP